MKVAIDHHQALVYVMIMASAVDRRVSARELAMIGEMTVILPVFADFDRDRIVQIAQDCTAVLDQEHGAEAALDLVQEALPSHLRETAYALACDVIATDGRVSETEARFIDILRRRLGVGRLAGAAIERGARARFMTL
jgi:tellurite resistance protein